MVRSVFGDVPQAGRLGHWLYERSEGHPLMCMELVHILMDRGVVRYRDGTWVLPHTLDDVQLAPRLEDADGCSPRRFPRNAGVSSIDALELLCCKRDPMSRPPSSLQGNV